MVASHVPPTGDLAHNPGMCPDWESNQRPFGSQAGTQSTEPHQPGPNLKTFKNTTCALLCLLRGGSCCHGCVLFLGNSERRSEPALGTHCPFHPPRSAEQGALGELPLGPALPKADIPGTSAPFVSLRLLSPLCAATGREGPCASQHTQKWL